MSARFTVGFPYRNNDVIMYELKEFLVTIDTQDINATAPKVNQIQVQFAFESKSFQKWSNLKVNRTGDDGKKEKVSMMYHMNDRLVPKVLDDGRIEGSFLMINNIASEKEPAIVNETSIENIKKLDKRGIYSDQRQLDWITTKIGQQVIIYRVDDWYDTFHILFQDGRKLTLTNLDWNPFKGQESAREKYKIDPSFFYEMIDLQIGNQIHKSALDIGCRLQNKLYMVSSHRIAYKYQPNFQIVLVQASMSKPAIKEQVFEGYEATIELYNLGKNAISLSMPNFKELYYFDKF